jgi:hypothetical protein
MTINEMAESVLEKNRKISPKEEVFIDPVTIMLICSILSMVFSALRAWIAYRKSKEGEPSDSAKEVAALCQRRPMLLRKAVKKIIRQKVGYVTFVNYKEQLVNTILDTCAETNVKDLDSLVYCAGQQNNLGWKEV